MIKNTSGQIAVEFILISIIILSLSLAIGRGLRQSEYLSKMTGGPWALLTGMIENGVWEKPQVAKTMHPNFLKRQVSFKGDVD
ncbi:MAG: hypothetical protein KDD37_05250 [Bdellovibrionales bacterium]|nr:hypothetical protein [Bdellovibrionales bacterium]